MHAGRARGLADVGFVFFSCKKKFVCTPFLFISDPISRRIRDFSVKTDRMFSKQPGPIQNKGVVFAKRRGIY